MTDLKRAVPYALEEIDFEPKHIHYLSVRRDVIDIIETRVDENTGKLVSFGSGMISVTLHFKLSKEFYLSLPSHSNPNEFPQNRSNSQFSLFTTSPIGWKDSDRKWVWVVSPSQTSTSTWCDSRRWPNISGVLVGYWFRLSVHKVSWAPKLLPCSWCSRASYTVTTSWTISLVFKFEQVKNFKWPIINSRNPFSEGKEKTWSWITYGWTRKSWRTRVVCARSRSTSNRPRTWDESEPLKRAHQWSDSTWRWNV